jgi:acetyltransferase-like isoleucine patch superfamily enzyme
MKISKQQMASQYLCIADDVKLGKNVKLSKFINLYGCVIDDNTKIGAFVEIQKGATIGKNCKISSHSFICEGVSISDGVFIGHSVVFINDNHPRATTAKGAMEGEKEWKKRFVKTKLGKNVSIGSNTTILGSITIGNGAMVGAGSVVTKNIPAGEIWMGNPAKFYRKIGKK